MTACLHTYSEAEMIQLPEFCLIGIRINRDRSVGQKILKSNVIYPLMKGYELSGQQILYKSHEACIRDLYDGYLGQYSLMHVSVSAIVGANGSGKSTLIEYMIRLLNNFAASVYGEDELHPGAEHLHYIGGMYGELYFVADRTPHLLRVSDGKIELYEYERQIPTTIDETERQVRFVRKQKAHFLRDDYKTWRSSDDRYYGRWRKTRETCQKVMNHFFYTFVSNYSLYAYNAYDFKEEWNSEEKELQIRLRATRLDMPDEPIGREQRCWLEGIFHKNDGYQTPIVLTPYRDHGNININKEHDLSNERLIALLLRDIGYKTLNGHLEVESFTFSKSEHIYDVAYVNMRLGTLFRKGGFRRLRGYIMGAWKKKYNCTFAKSDNVDLQPIALNYLAYKTIKVAATYGQYRKYYEKIFDVKKYTKARHRDAIEGLVESLSKDESHITTKIRQTLCFLTRCNFVDGEKSVYLQDAINCCKASLHSMKDDYRDNLPLMITKMEDALPAPFLKVIISLREANGQTVTFDKLSSGERQQIYSISSILYHLSNIESVHSDKTHRRITYNKVCVILEEIELYYHPQLQQEFLLYLLNGLRQVKLPEIKAVSVIIVTHSPFVLSDIPTTNILTMQEGEYKERELQSFGANIHDLLNSNFFMSDGSRGRFAEWIIKEVIKAVNLYAKKDEERTQEENRWLLNYPRKKLHRLIMTIDEPIVRRVLTEQMREAFNGETSEEEVARLERRIKELKQTT